MVKMTMVTYQVTVTMVTYQVMVTMVTIPVIPEHTKHCLRWLSMLFSSEVNLVC